MNDVDCVVIGGGVVGLAAARALAMAGREVIILEREEHFGSQTSARNSEVIHAGIYYERGSLKARACLAGSRLLYAYCAERDIPHRRCGKLIVASTEAQIGQLRDIEAHARMNGVEDIHYLQADEVARLEPDIKCVGALLSPSTGIIDSHALMLSFLGDAESRGAMIVYSVNVTAMLPTRAGIEINVDSQDEPTVRAATVINCAGLDAPRVASSIRDFPRSRIPEAWYAKGTYFEVMGRTPFKRLIYPVPEPGGLGIHLTLDLTAKARFGPDVEWVDEIDYRVDLQRAAMFYPAIRQYWPGLADGQLQPGYAGVRPKISGPRSPAADFCISGPALHGVPGIVNLFGIESPGLTASLALADEITAMVTAAQGALA
jgi:L-2-hydroxyglutarate oxidase LhgO